MNLAIARRRHDSAKILEVRPLTTADLSTLHRPTAKQRLKGLRDFHHTIARQIAIGKTYTAISQDLGISVARISILCQDPTFIELLTKYRSEAHEIWREHVDCIAEDSVRTIKTGIRAIATQFEELDDNPTALPLRDVANITTGLMDRFGYGKHTTSTNVNIGFAAKLEACISRSRKVAAE